MIQLMKHQIGIKLTLNLEKAFRKNNLMINIKVTLPGFNKDLSLNYFF